VSQVLWHTPDGETVRVDVRLNELENVGGEVCLSLHALSLSLSLWLCVMYVLDVCSLSVQTHTHTPMLQTHTHRDNRANA
jgi:hypothetical protein